MSFSVWVGDKPERKLNFYSLRLDECGGDIQELAKRAAWKCPVRVYGRDPKLITQFLHILDTDYSMSTNDPSQVRVLGE